jgi:tetratricopeptide (TPR) repeat protein
MEGQAATQLNQHVQSVQDLADEATQKIQQRMNEPEGTTVQIAADAAKALAEVARAAINKPEIDYTFQDWSNRAYAAYNQNDKDAAARFWREAAAHPSSNADAKAQALFNAGVVLGELKRPDEAIATYNSLVERFGKGESLALKEAVAKALVNKGHELGKMERHDEELAAHDAVIERFGNEELPPLKIQVAMARVNKGNALGKMERIDEAIAAYDTVIERFGKDENPALKEQVAVALNSKGFSLLCRAKERWARADRRIDDLEAAEALFEKAARMQPGNGVIMGNQAYCDHLLGRSEDMVREKLGQALEQGGEFLYVATLSDLATHPIPDIDDKFRALLDALWAAESSRRSPA